MQQFEQQKRKILSALLSDLENELKSLQLWGKNTPSKQALASVSPFAIDTLSFPEWLQFVFIKKMTQLLQIGAPLPTSMAIAPMATEYFKILATNNNALITVITRIDMVINENSKC
jgi:uncharacterized protein YqcC (DUF446 family)